MVLVVSKRRGHHLVIQSGNLRIFKIATAVKPFSGVKSSVGQVAIFHGQLCKYQKVTEDSSNPTLGYDRMLLNSKMVVYTCGWTVPGSLS